MKGEMSSHKSVIYKLKKHLLNHGKIFISAERLYSEDECVYVDEAPIQTHKHELMNLGNKTQNLATFQITTANGREIASDVKPSSTQSVDLSKYLSPFSVQATVDGTTTGMAGGLGENQSVTVYFSGSGYALMVGG